MNSCTQQTIVVVLRAFSLPNNLLMRATNPSTYNSNPESGSNAHCGASGAKMLYMSNDLTPFFLGSGDPHSELLTLRPFSFHPVISEACRAVCGAESGAPAFDEASVPLDKRKAVLPEQLWQVEKWLMSTFIDGEAPAKRSFFLKCSAYCLESNLYGLVYQPCPAE